MKAGEPPDRPVPDEPTPAPGASLTPPAEDGAGSPRLRTTPRRRPAARRRFPAWLAVPVAAFGGFTAAGRWGAVLGAVVGLVLWWGQGQR